MSNNNVKQKTEAPPPCPDCGTQMRDAGAIGMYCPNRQCPGIAKSQKWAKEQVDLYTERQALEFLHKRGYQVEKPS